MRRGEAVRDRWQSPRRTGHKDGSREVAEGMWLSHRPWSCSHNNQGWIAYNNCGDAWYSTAIYQTGLLLYCKFSRLLSRDYTAGIPVRYFQYSMPDTWTSLCLNDELRWERTGPHVLNANHNTDAYAIQVSSRVCISKSMMSGEQW